MPDPRHAIASGDVRRVHVTAADNDTMTVGRSCCGPGDDAGGGS